MTSRSVFLVVCFLLLNVYYGCGAQQQQNSSALYISTIPASIGRTSDKTCPSLFISTSRRATITQEIKQALQDTINPLLDNQYGSSHSCGSGGWTRVAHLNMANINQQCPSNWTLLINTFRGCGRTSSSYSSCNSVIFSANNLSYSKVCGRVVAYQRGSTRAFYPYITNNRITIDEAYLSGVSLTHGAAGSRQHIWSFVAAQFEQYSSTISCPCTAKSTSWPYLIPPFVGFDYFCDSGNSGYSTINSVVYSSDPLWDGAGCPLSSSCCEYNNPPWFTTSLPVPTSDDLEVRLCNSNDATREDVIVSLVEIYVK